MKKTILVALLLTFVTTVVFGQEHRIDFERGRAKTFMKRSQRFINATREAYPDFTSDDWSYSLDEYTKMVNEYRDCSDGLNREEKSEFTRMRGEYVGFATKAGANQVVKGAQKLYKSVAPFFEGLIESFKDSTRKEE